MRGFSGRKELPGLQAKARGQPLHRFEPDLLFTSRLDLLIELIVQPDGLSEFLLRQFMALAEPAKAGSKSNKRRHTSELRVFGVDQTPRDHWCAIVRVRRRSGPIVAAGPDLGQASRQVVEYG